MQLGLLLIEGATNEWSQGMAKEATKNPLSLELNWMGFLADLHSGIDMDKLKPMLEKVINEELEKPTTRQEVIDRIYREATKRGDTEK